MLVFVPATLEHKTWLWVDTLLRIHCSGATTVGVKLDLDDTLRNQVLLFAYSSTARFYHLSHAHGSPHPQRPSSSPFIASAMRLE